MSDAKNPDGQWHGRIGHMGMIQESGGGAITSMSNSYHYATASQFVSHSDRRRSFAHLQLNHVLGKCATNEHRREKLQQGVVTL